MKMTKHRKAILTHLTNEKTALSAQALHEALPDINLVTIYRNLEAFAASGVIKKLCLSSTEAVYEFQNHPHHHVICGTCQKIEHVAVDETKLKDALGIKNFELQNIDIVVHGKCRHTHDSA